MSRREHGEARRGFSGKTETGKRWLQVITHARWNSPTTPYRGRENKRRGAGVAVPLEGSLGPQPAASRGLPDTW